MANTHVLIIEDNQDLAQSIQLILEAAGYQTEAGILSGEDALRRLKDKQPDLILIDLKLAGRLDGVDTALGIQQSYDIPLVFLTGHSDPESWKRAREVNPYGFLLKPFNKTDLQHVVELALHTHSVERNLRLRKSYYRGLFENAHDAIIIYSVDGHIVLDVNQRACQIYGYEREEFIGMPLASISLDCSSEDERILNLVQENNSENEFLAHHICKDGRHITLELPRLTYPLSRGKGCFEYQSRCNYPHPGRNGIRTAPTST